MIFSTYNSMYAVTYYADEQPKLKRNVLVEGSATVNFYYKEANVLYFMHTENLVVQCLTHRIDISRYTGDVSQLIPMQ